METYHKLVFVLFVTATAITLYGHFSQALR